MYRGIININTISQLLALLLPEPSYNHHTGTVEIPFTYTETT